MSTVEEEATAKALPYTAYYSCLFCNKDCASPEFKKKQVKLGSKKVAVSTIEKDDTLQKMKTALHQLGEKNEQAMSIIKHLSTENILGKAHYHRHCYQNILRSTTVADTGLKQYVEEFIEYVINYIAENERCNYFHLQSITNEYVTANTDKKVPSNITVLKKLKEKLDSDSMYVASYPRHGTVIFRIDCVNFILLDYYCKKESDSKKASTDEDDALTLYKQNNDTIQNAVNIIVQDIEKCNFEFEYYPAATEFFDLKSLDSYIPRTLFEFLSQLITYKKKNPSDWYNNIIAISHSILSLVFPIKVQSPLQIGLAVTLYHRYGSRDLIDTLSSLGFCSSYHQLLLYQTSVIKNRDEPLMSQCFSQFVFDNADHNVCTIDGYNTFHYMGGIEIVVPSHKVKHSRIRKEKKLPKSDTFKLENKISVKNFKKDKTKNLGDLKMEEFNESLTIGNYYAKIINVSKSDFLWLYSKFVNILQSTGWNHFMEILLSKNNAEKCRILYLPFILAPPSDHNTINTSLFMASTRAAELNITYAYVSFDLPLYFKALEIVQTTCHENLKNVVPILGGFHLLMSFLGSIGAIMDGSGIKEMLSLIYAENSIPYILNGKAYSRAVRGHVLIHCAISNLIFDMIQLTEEDKDFLGSLLLEMKEKSVIDKLAESRYTIILKKFNDKVEEIANSNHPTAQLWIQYFVMVTLVKKFLEAGRSSNWDMYLECIVQMLPIFHASGHNLYAKCAHLFVQNMKTLDREAHKNFIKNFTIRRTDKFYCGMFTDQAIETTLMKNFKDPKKGLTHGRGTKDTDVAKWVLSMPYFVDIFEGCQEFCNISIFGESDQNISDKHDDGGVLRVEKDNSDIIKMKEWLAQRSPFCSSNNLVSLSSGIVADSTINCHKAFKVGTESLMSISGKVLRDVTIRRKFSVKPLSNMSSKINTGKRDIIIDPTLLFQRIALVKKNEEELKHFFSYELAPYPLSLFDEKGMRKNTKSDLYDLFDPLLEVPIVENPTFVIDGGYLLHKVIWPKDSTYYEILQFYVRYVKEHYSSKSFIIFDGYSDQYKSTKNCERIRRSHSYKSPDVKIRDVHDYPPIPQNVFLVNSKNKEQFVSFLIKELNNEGFETMSCNEDADTFIIEKALMKRFDLEVKNEVIIVGQDIDLLILLTHCGYLYEEPVYFLKPKIGKQPEKYFTQHSFKHPELKNTILFIHAFAGCDTTSAFAGVGKKKIISILLKYPKLKKDVKEFYNSDASTPVLNAIGQSTIRALYGFDPNKDLELSKVRFNRFIKRTNKTACKLVDLPPTKEAANLHIARVYLQMQKWLKNDVEPKYFGWHMTSQGYMPTSLPPKINPLPESLLQSISCKCASGCKTKACSCRKLGLHCTSACGKCGGTDCTNIEEILDLPEVDDESNLNNEDSDTNAQSDIQEIEDELSDSYSFTTDCTFIEEQSDNLLFGYESSDSNNSCRSSSSNDSRKRKRIR